MNNSSAPIFDRCAALDFIDARPVREVPALAKLPTQHGSRSRINMGVDHGSQADVVLETTRKELPRT